MSMTKAYQDKLNDGPFLQYISHTQSYSDSVGLYTLYDIESDESPFLVDITQMEQDSDPVGLHSLPNKPEIT